MTRPVRLRLSRKKGFDLQKLSRETNGLPARVVARPSQYGNPFKVGASIDPCQDDWQRLVDTPPLELIRNLHSFEFKVTPEIAVELHRQWLQMMMNADEKAFAAWFVRPDVIGWESLA